MNNDDKTAEELADEIFFEELEKELNVGEIEWEVSEKLSKDAAKYHHDREVCRVDGKIDFKRLLNFSDLTSRKGS